MVEVSMSWILARTTSRMALGVSLVGIACSSAARIEERSGDPESVGENPPSNGPGGQGAQAGSGAGNPELPLVVETHDGKLRPYSPADGRSTKGNPLHPRSRSLGGDSRREQAGGGVPPARHERLRG